MITTIQLRSYPELDPWILQLSQRKTDIEQSTLTNSPSDPNNGNTNNNLNTTTTTTTTTTSNNNNGNNVDLLAGENLYDSSFTPATSMPISPPVPHHNPNHQTSIFGTIHNTNNSNNANNNTINNNTNNNNNNSNNTNSSNNTTATGNSLPSNPLTPITTKQQRASPTNDPMELDA